MTIKKEILKGILKLPKVSVETNKLFRNENSKTFYF